MPKFSVEAGFRWMRTALAFCLIVLLVLVATRREPDIEAHIELQTMIVNLNSGLCLAIGSGATYNGAGAVQWPCRDYPDQRVDIIDAGEGYHTIEFFHSGKCLTVQNASTSNGARLVQWDCVGGSNQKWSGAFTEGAGYEVHSSQLNPDKCITVQNGSTGYAAKIIQWDCVNGTSKNWTIVGQLSGITSPYTAFGPYSYKDSSCNDWTDPIGVVFVLGDGDIQQPYIHAQLHGGWDFPGFPGVEGPQFFDDYDDSCSEQDAQAASNAGICEGRYHMRWEHALTSVLSWGHVYAATPHYDTFELGFPVPCGHCIEPGGFTLAKDEIWNTWVIEGPHGSLSTQSVWWGNNEIRLGCDGQQVFGNGWVYYIDMRH